ncbi:MAG TPA: DUF4440 domain-containing protein [Allocoleopsis sp.]
MKILILGGTQFLGRHFVEIALQQGHQVTVLNRGQTNPGLYPDVEQLIGDRVERNLDALRGRTWDIAIDTAGHFPQLDQVVRDTAELLQNSIQHYIFISTISVYAELKANGDENLPLYHEIPTAETGADAQIYGANKVRAEAVVQDIYGDRGLIVRPGLIVGPYDPTGRFTYWVRRVAQGGEILAPESSELPVQVIDARDLVQWIYRMVCDRKGGIYNAIGPDAPLTLGQILEACQTVSANPVSLTWVPGTFLEAQGVEHWQELPLWLPNSLQQTFFCLSNRKALDAGLQFRPLTDTIHDILQWDAIAQPEYSSGLSRDKEKAILQAWHQQRIEDLEEKLQQAMLSSDVAVLDELIADDLVWTMHAGFVGNKEYDLEAHRSGIFQFTKLDISDRQIHLFSRDCIIVTLKADIAGLLDGQAFSEVYRFTRVWLQRNNRWQIAAGHVSQIVPLVNQGKEQATPLTASAINKSLAN